jgi:hypothetical protein
LKEKDQVQTLSATLSVVVFAGLLEPIENRYVTDQERMKFKKLIRLIVFHS